MPLLQTVAPASEPVSRAEAKNHCRIDSDLTADDTLIDLMISAARRYAEKDCARSFITQQWRLVMDSFPGPSLMGMPYGEVFTMPGHAIQLERGPVQSVDSIKYLDSGTLITLATSAYVSDLTGPVPRVTPVFGQIWPPISTPQIGNVQVNYTAGYGNAATNVPESVRLWMLVAVQTVYKNRGLMIQLGRGEKVEAFNFIDGLLDGERVVVA